MTIESKIVNQQIIALFSEPSFNVWTSLFLFVALQAFFIGMGLLFFGGHSRKANQLLGVLVLGFSIVIFSWTLYWTGYNKVFPYLNHFYHILPYVAGPLFFLYTRNVIRERSLEINDSLHFVPAALITMLLSPFLLGNFIPVNYESLPRGWYAFTINWYTKIILLGTYTFFSYRLIKNFNDQEKHKKKWLELLVFAFGGYVFSLLSYYILVQFSFFNPIWDYGVSFALSFFIFIVSFMGYLQPRVFAGESVKEILIPEKYKKTGLTRKAEYELRDRLEEAMIIDKLYTNGDLRLDDLAEFVHSNRHHVSQVINQHFKMNYFDFLNYHRVDHVKRLIKNPKYYNDPLIQLAYEAGFNNKVSFNKAFKKNTGTTPSAYKKEQFSDQIKE